MRRRNPQEWPVRLLHQSYPCLLTRVAGHYGLAVGALRGALLHRQFGLQAVDIAEDRGNCKAAPLVLEAENAVSRRDLTLDRDLVPFGGVADIVDRQIVMLAPEERNGGKLLAIAEHIAC